MTDTPARSARGANATLAGLLLAVILAGAALRLAGITQNNFVFFDEGYYLDYSRPLGELIEHYGLNSWEDFRRGVSAYAQHSLSTGKALWFFIVDARFFFGAVRTWAFARIVAATCGLLTLAVTFRFAARWFADRRAGILAAALLSVLPSHVFYSRLGMQETLSTLLVLLGFHLYLFSSGRHWRTFAAGACFAGGYFSNYRMIILPALLGVAEGWCVFSRSRPFDGRRFVWCGLTMAAIIVGVGDLFDAVNARVTFAWMFHQADLARGHFDGLNLLSYPYYLFRLDNPVFALLFFVGGAWLTVCRRKEALPFVLAAGHMLVFSLASDKAARYLCVMTPFMAASVAGTLFAAGRRPDFARWAAAAVAALAVLMMAGQSFALVRVRSDYRASAGFLLGAPGAKFLSTQKYIHDLYAASADQVAECPRSERRLVELYDEGFRTMAIGPQAYVSLTQSGRAFERPLVGYAEFAVDRLKPLRIFPNLQGPLLERFVFEHSQNLRRSIAFLAGARHRHAGEIAVYDLAPLVRIIRAAGLPGEAR